MKKIAVIGGDERSIEAAKMLMKEGWCCAFFGFEDREKGQCGGLRSEQCEEPYRPDEALVGADALLLPLPLTRDGENLNAPFCAEKMQLQTILKIVPEELKVFGGGFPSAFAEKRGKKVVDLLKSEEFARQNALPTAEGAIGLAILDHPGILEGSVCAVIGYGKIGSVIAQKLAHLGAEVEVFARREESRENARTRGIASFQMKELEKRIGRYDLIFNTVPSPILSADGAAGARSDSLYIELASSPFGLTKEGREALACRHIMASGLPGKYAPRYAGKIIAKTILSHFSDFDRENERN